MSGTRALTLVASQVGPGGGMERVAFELCSRLIERGWSVTVVARSCDLPPSARLRFVPLPSPSRPVAVALLADFVLAPLALLRARRGLVQTNNPTIASRVDVINVHFCERGYQAQGGPPRSRSSHVAYRLNSWLASRVSMAMEWWCLRVGRTRAVACVSQGVAREVVRHYPRAPAPVVIPNGVDRRRFAPDADGRRRTRAAQGLPEGARVAVFVGGDWHRKGLRAAIEGVAAARDWHLVVAGVGDVEHFRALAARRGAGERVRFVGRLSDPAPVYAAGDVLLFPSAYEAFSLVTLEAAASGLALVVPRINGTEELVEDGVNGWFTPARAEAITARLDALSGDPELLSEAQAAARRSSEPYDWERVADRYEELYDALSPAGSG